MGGWVGWSAPPPGRFTPGEDAVPIVQEAGWAPEPVWNGAENLSPTGIRSPDRPARSKSQYRLSYPDPCYIYVPQKSVNTPEASFSFCFLETCKFLQKYKRDEMYRFPLSIVFFFKLVPGAQSNEHPVLGWLVNTNFTRFRLAITVTLLKVKSDICSKELKKNKKKSP